MSNIIFLHRPRDGSAHRRRRLTPESPVESQVNTCGIYCGR